MNMIGHLTEAYVNLLSAKMRSFLAVLGVLVGTASVVALVSGGQLATEHALEQFKQLGTDLMSATIQNVSQQQSNQQDTLSVDDINHMVDQNNDVLEASAYALGFSPILFQGKTLHGSIVGVTENLKTIIKARLAQGRFISDLDRTQRFCVLGNELANSILQPGEQVANLIGKQIQTNEAFFTVVGVLQPSAENMFFLVNLNKAMLVPIESALNMNRYARINNMVLRFSKDADLAQLKNALTVSMQQIDPRKKLFFRSPQEIINSMQSQNRTFTLLLGFIGSIALIVGGIGVMNIMLVSVVERKREIGVRLAVGAKQRDIMLMFLSESITLTLFGGLLGVLLGEAVAYLTAQFSGWTFHLYGVPLLVGFSVSALVGMFFGIYPATKASKSDPIECLRA